MNARTAKLIRRYSQLMGCTIRSAKRGWLKTPRNQRWMNRAMMKQEVGCEPLVKQTYEAWQLI